jgi:penicillin-binding protein 1A
MRLPDLASLASILTRSRATFLAGVLAVSIGAWSSVGASVWYLHDALDDLPDQHAVERAGTMPRATTIADARGRHAFTVFEERRLHVPLSRISPHLVRAILAIEDRRFYDHRGIDPIRIAGAAVHNLAALRAEQGGSTITQQLARLSLLNADKTFRRKIREAVLATRLERIFSKDDILELYLNRAYFGDGLYGVEAAALGYFGTHASNLSLAEAALVAGLVKAPSSYAPTINPKRAVARRNLVLRVMRDTGTISETACEAAVATPLRLLDTLRREEAFGRYFKEDVRKWLVETYGWDRVYQGGLRVETTIDLDMQKAAEAEVARAIADIEKRQARGRRPQKAGDALQAALVAIDPRTGEVRAMVGGRAFDRSAFNRVTQSRRQPGSAFKPFVYAAALEMGYTPASLIGGLNDPILTATGAYLPEDGHLDADAITMRAALRVSSNRAAVRMLDTIGIPAAVKSAGQLGIGDLPRVPSLALGSGEVTLLSMTSAFGAFANSGVLAPPALVRKVTSAGGEVLYEAKAAPRRAVSEATAFLLTSMLQDVVDAGTASQARQIGFRLPAAGKTGTTNAYRDAWFVGYTPRLVTGVWIGYDSPRTIVSGGYAAELAVPLWTRFMMKATERDKAEAFRVPSTITAVEICPLSGHRATDACRHAQPDAVRSEYFPRGTEPIQVCLQHRGDVFRALAAEGAVPLPAAPPVVAAAAATADEPDAIADSPVDDSAPAKKKKRGFWARLFGVGGDDRKDEKK